MGIPKNYFKNLFAKKSIKINTSGMTANVNFSFLGEKLDYAQDAMKWQLVQDMLKYVPTGDTNGLRNDILMYNELSGERGTVYAYNPNGVPYGHYQHEGVMYADPITGKGAFYSQAYGFWSRPGVAKVATTRPLSYSNPNARKEWLRYAVEHDRKDVIRAGKEAFRRG